MDEIKLKYVRLGEFNEFIIFPITIEHSLFQHQKPISAGFCYIQDNKVICFGESYSLKLKSLDDDTKLATKQVFGFDAMLNL